jgi:hypothetical protein
VRVFADRKLLNLRNCTTDKNGQNATLRYTAGTRTRCVLRPGGGLLRSLCSVETTQRGSHWSRTHTPSRVSLLPTADLESRSAANIHVLKRKHPRSRLSVGDQVFWVFLRRVWSRWADLLVIVKTGHRRAVASCRIPVSMGAGFPGARREAGQGWVPRFVN